MKKGKKCTNKVCHHGSRGDDQGECWGGLNENKRHGRQHRCWEEEKGSQDNGCIDVTSPQGQNELCGEERIDGTGKQVVTGQQKEEQRHGFGMAQNLWISVDKDSRLYGDPQGVPNEFITRGSCQEW